MTTELVPPADPNDAIEQLKARIAELEAELAAARASSTATAGERDAANTQLGQLREQLAELQRPPAPRTERRRDGFYFVD
jgi:phage shock protein A